MIEVPAGNGEVFFTRFHNHAQASAEEGELPQLLVLKQIRSGEPPGRALSFGAGVGPGKRG